jgi:RNA recognition motif-containing protein
LYKPPQKTTSTSISFLFLFFLLFEFDLKMKAASAPRREERPAGEKEQKKEQTKKDGEAPAPAVPEAPTHIPGRLFVGGLPRDVTPDALSNLLGAFGVRVEHVEFNTKHVPILGMAHLSFISRF